MGQYDMGHSASYYWKGKVPNTLYFTSMPFGMNAQEQWAWFYQGGGMELIQEVYETHRQNIKTKRHLNTTAELTKYAYDQQLLWLRTAPSGAVFR